MERDRANRQGGEKRRGAAKKRADKSERALQALEPEVGLSPQAAGRRGSRVCSKMRQEYKASGPAVQRGGGIYADFAAQMLRVGS
ncbi:hypothetical protein DBR47_04120 [Paucibacter sp. KBW04]|nr:hypothetical protein DBR47_04120 [Paucibacter sp. KBW04]